MYADWQSWLLILAAFIFSFGNRRIFERLLILLVLACIVLTYSLQVRTGAFFPQNPASFLDFLDLKSYPALQNNMNMMVQLWGPPAEPLSSLKWKERAEFMTRYSPLYYFTQARFGVVVMGALLAVALFDKDSTLHKSFLPVHRLCGPIGLSLVTWLVYSPLVSLPFAFLGHTLFGLALFLMLFGVLSNPQDFFSRLMYNILGMRMFSVLAPFSYAVYLFHVPIGASLWAIPLPSTGLPCFKFCGECLEH